MVQLCGTVTMDPLSVALGCVALLPPIAQASSLITKFVVQVRDARREMDMVQAELVSLRSVLEILAQDLKDYPETHFPTHLVEDIKRIIVNCEAAVNQIEDCIMSHQNDNQTRKKRWAVHGREKMLELKSTLNAYQMALSMAVDTLNLSISKAVKFNTDLLLVNTSEIKEDTSQILQEIAKLQARLPPGEEWNGSHYLLQRYFDSLSSYAESSAGLEITPIPEDQSYRSTPEKSLRLPRPLEGGINYFGNYAREPASSSSETPSYHISGSTSKSASIQAPLPGLPLLQISNSLECLPNSNEPSLYRCFPISETSKYKRRARPWSIPHPTYAEQAHTDLVYALCQTDQFIISGSRDQSIRVWNSVKRSLEYPALRGHNSSVHSLVADGAKDILISCGGNGSIIVWQLSTGLMKNEILLAHADSILSLQLNDRYLVSTSKDCTAKVWDRAFLEERKEGRHSEPFAHCVLRNHEAPINDTVLTDNDIITACGDRIVRVFDIDSATCTQRMSSHKKTIVALALSSDGDFIFSAGGDSDIVVHHKTSGQTVARLQGHSDLVRALATVTENNLLISGSYDETVAIWAVNADGTWRKERSLDVKETQRNLGLDLKNRQRSHDFTENIRQAVENGAEPAALSSAKVFCLLPQADAILCGAGCNIIGWKFNEVDEDAEIEEMLFRDQLASPKHGTPKSKGFRLFKGLANRR